MLAACSAQRSAHPESTTPSRPAAAPASLTPDVVLAKIEGGYRIGVQRCYARYLKHASGHGRVMVSFTVDERGRALDGQASGVPARLGGCIVAEVARWQFPPARTAQSFALPIDLRAN